MIINKMSKDTIYVEITNSNKIYDENISGSSDNIPTSFDLDLPLENGNRFIGPNNRNIQKYKVTLLNLVMPNSEVEFYMNRYSSKSSKPVYGTGPPVLESNTFLSDFPYIYISLGSQRSSNFFSNNINVTDNNLQFRVIIDHLNDKTAKLVTLRPMEETLDLAINLNDKITFSVYLSNGQPLKYQKLTKKTNVKSSEYLFHEISALFSFQPCFDNNSNILS